MSKQILVRGDIYLSEIAEEDLPGLALAINHPSIAKNTLNIPHPYHASDAREYFDKVLRRKKEAGFQTNFLVKNDGVICGEIGLAGQNGYDAHRSEFGYWVSHSQRNAGIATAVVKAFVKHVFDTTAFIRLEATTFCDNIASQKVLEKNGFLREGLLRKYVKKNDQLLDVYFYSLLHPSIT